MKGKEILVFLFFLALAGVFWLLTTLNESFEQEVHIPLRFTNVPKDVVLTSGEADTLRVTVRDKGISLITYLYKTDLTPVIIDFNRYKQADGTGVVPRNDLLRLVETRLPASATALSVKPENERFYYNYGERKRVPVRLKGQVEPDPLYFIADTIMSADTVTIYASRQKLDSIKYVTTETLRCVGFADSTTVNTRLQPMVGVKMVPANITVHFVADMLTEVTVDDIPVGCENMPQGKVLRTFPAKVSAHFVTGVKNAQRISVVDFSVVADYFELVQDSLSQCNVYLHSYPAGIERVRLEPDHVDFLIEENP